MKIRHFITSHLIVTNLHDQARTLQPPTGKREARRAAAPRRTGKGQRNHRRSGEITLLTEFCSINQSLWDVLLHFNMKARLWNNVPLKNLARSCGGNEKTHPKSKRKFGSCTREALTNFLKSAYVGCGAQWKLCLSLICTYRENYMTQIKVNLPKISLAVTHTTVAISTSFEFRSGQFCNPHSGADLPEILEGSQLQRSSKRKWECAWESVNFQSSQDWNANEPFWGIVNPEEFAVGMQGYCGNAFSLMWLP